MIKPMLKAPGYKRLKSKYDEVLSILLKFCFQFQLAPLQHGRVLARLGERCVARDGVPLHRGKAVQVDSIKPTLKAPGTKRLKLKYD